MSFVLFALFSLCAAYTHYYALLSVAFFYVVLLIRIFLTHQNIKATLLTSLFTIIGYLPWLPVLIYSYLRIEDNFWFGWDPTVKDCLLFVLSTGRTRTTEILTIICFAICLFVVIKNIRSPFVLWMFSSVISFAGMVGIGLILGAVNGRNMIQLRYFLPISSCIWMTVSFAITKLKHSHLIGALVLFLLLFLGLPNDLKMYKEERRRDLVTRKTSQFINEKCSPDTVFITDNIALYLYLYDYYYPGRSHLFIDRVSDELFDLQEDRSYWLMLMFDPDDIILSWVDRNNYQLKELYHDAQIGDNRIDIYELQRR